MSGLAMASIATNVNKFPCGGPRFVKIPCDFTATQQINVDLTTMIANGGFIDAQALFIDNSKSAQTLSVTNNTTGQVIICPPNAQGYFPMLFNGQNGSLTIGSGGGTFATVEVLNFPVVACTWSAAVASGPGGPTEVTDTTLAAIIGTYGVETSQEMLVNNTAKVLDLKASAIYSEQAAVGVSSGTLIAGGSFKFYFNRIRAYCSDDAIWPAGSYLSITDGPTEIARFPLPSVAGPLHIFDMGDVHYYSTGVAQALAWSTSADKTAGTLYLIATGGISTAI